MRKATTGRRGSRMQFHGFFPVTAEEDREDSAAYGDHLWTGEAVRLLGLTRRQLVYWAQIGYFVPSTRSPGGHARYSRRDLEKLRKVKALLDAGFSTHEASRILHALGDPLR